MTPEPVNILIAEPIDSNAIVWLREQGANPILAFEDDAWREVADQIPAMIYRGQILIDDEYMDGLPALRIIGKHGVGINTIDLRAAADRHIVVTNTPGANANSVAEHAILLLLAATRALVPADRLVRTGGYADRLGLSTAKELLGRKLGIVGGGRIGRRVAEIARSGFDCSIGILDPFIATEEIEYLGATLFDDADDMCVWADMLVIAAPLTSQSTDLISTSQLKALGPDGVVVISSRGGIVNEVALTLALSDGIIRAAGIDVYDPEPPASNNPLFELDNVVLTPHNGGLSDRAQALMAKRVAEQVWALLNGGTAPIANQDWL